MTSDRRAAAQKKKIFGGWILHANSMAVEVLRCSSLLPSLFCSYCPIEFDVDDP
jgi:hypothetical protein